MASSDGGDGRAAAAPGTRAQRRGVRRLHESMGAFEAQLQCPICLCAYAAPASLPCNHCFCEECIHRALELKQVCPICKAPAKKRSLRSDTMIQQLQQASELWMSVAGGAAVEEEEAEEEEVKEEREEMAKPNGSHAPSRIDPPAAVTDSTKDSDDEEIVRRHEHEQRRQEEEEEESASDQPTAPRDAPPSESSEDEDNVQYDDDDDDDDSDFEELETKQATPDRDEPPAKKRAIANGVATANGGTQIPVPVSVFASHDGVDGMSPSDSNGMQGFTVGQLVEVVDRTWRGVNKPGGVAWIVNRHDNSTYDVKYVIGSGREMRVPDQYILIAREEIVSPVTPRRAVKYLRRKQTKLATPPSVDLLGGHNLSRAVNGVPAAQSWRADIVFLCSGYTDEELAQISVWANAVDAQMVDHWSHYVTHLVVKCATRKEYAASLAEEDHAPSAMSQAALARKRALFKEDAQKRWVKTRSMKYLMALAGGRWIVSEDWLRDCARQGKRLAESGYEIDGHLKAQNSSGACKRSRTMREEILRSLTGEVEPSTVGTRMFESFCFHIHGEFLAPMPPPMELDMLITIGGGKTIKFFDDLAIEMDKPANHARTLVIVTDAINQLKLRRTAKELMARPQLQGVGKTQFVSYKWLLDSIGEAKLRPFA